MATLKEVSKEIMEQLNELSVNGGLGRFIAINLHTLTLDRIFTKGLKSDGTAIGTYADYTIRKKKKKNRFTSRKVNLRNTEQMVNDYLVTGKKTSRGDEWKIGFALKTRSTDEDSDISSNERLKEKLEAQYGDIFSLTNEEVREIDNLMGDFMDKIFR